MGKPIPTYDLVLVDAEGNEVAPGENGEICIRTDKEIPCGLFTGYYNDEEQTKEVWHDGLYHTRTCLAGRGRLPVVRGPGR